MFWFSAHPLLITSILPALGFALEKLSSTEQRPSAATTHERNAFFAFALLSCTVWGQHMAAAGISAQTALSFSLLGIVSMYPLVYLVIRAFHYTRSVSHRHLPELLPALSVFAALCVLIALAMLCSAAGMAVSTNLLLFSHLGLALVSLLIVLGMISNLLASWHSDQLG
ncbi:MAG: hypothetical protein IPJ88_16010 [Myxococcales bacterium]|nr:MAG: hypothetical protein IPJ88_16010 [Myxococcales bacterium]